MINKDSEDQETKLKGSDYQLQLLQSNDYTKCPTITFEQVSQFRFSAVFSLLEE